MHHIECSLMDYSYFCSRKDVIMEKNQLTETVKQLRKQYGLTQEQLAMKSGVGLNFVRELEQGKPTVRLDKVNQVLDLFNYEMSPTPKTR